MDWDYVNESGLAFLLGYEDAVSENDPMFPDNFDYMQGFARGCEDK